MKIRRTIEISAHEDKKGNLLVYSLYFPMDMATMAMELGEENKERFFSKLPYFFLETKYGWMANLHIIYTKKYNGEDTKVNREIHEGSIIKSQDIKEITEQINAALDRYLQLLKEKKERFPDNSKKVIYIEKFIKTKEEKDE